MTNPILSVPMDIWREIFTFLDSESLDNAAKVCKTFQTCAGAPQVQEFVDRHPFEALARFYISNTDTQAILVKFHQLALPDQIAIKHEVQRMAEDFIEEPNWNWVEDKDPTEETGTIEETNWVDNQFQSNIKHPYIFKTLIAFGKLGLRLSALKDFQKTVNDPSLPSECVINALNKLSKVQWINLDPLLPQIFGPKLALKENNLAEAVKYFVWERCQNPQDDPDFGFNFIRNTPHAKEVIEAANDAEIRAINRFKIVDEFEADKRLDLLVENYQLDHFMKLHDPDALLCQFHNLDPAYQKLIKITIWGKNGRQLPHPSDWSDKELKVNIQTDAVMYVNAYFKNFKFKLTPETALHVLASCALTEFSDIISDTSKSSDDVMCALKGLEGEAYASGWNLAETFMFSVFLRLSPNHSECRSEQEKQSMLQEVSDFIREKPHHEHLGKSLELVSSNLRKLFKTATQKQG